MKNLLLKTKYTLLTLSLLLIALLVTGCNKENNYETLDSGHNQEISQKKKMKK